MNRIKIGTEFSQSGYGRGILRASVYLIDGFAYARSRYAWKTDYNQLTGSLEGYVRVNAIRSGPNEIFYQVSGTSSISKHFPYQPKTA